ncbi:MAG: DoxX family protein [Acidobacteriales bacterium]|nr:DoxX family protein [Terriglobales bacterium]
MKRILGRYEEIFFTLLRIVAGFLFACHGAQKLFGVLGGTRASEPVPMLAGIIEFGGGVLIMVGLLAGIAAFIASGEMAFAYVMVHAKGGFWPIINRGELAVLYCFLFLYIAAHGAGRWSIDGLKRRSLP